MRDNPWNLGKIPIHSWVLSGDGTASADKKTLMQSDEGFLVVFIKKIAPGEEPLMISNSTCEVLYIQDKYVNKMTLK